jgi:thiol-disulfide isomerase/thioredoxin
MSRSLARSPRILAALAFALALSPATFALAEPPPASPAPLHAYPAAPETPSPAAQMSPTPPAAPGAAQPRPEKPVLLGPIHREQVEEAAPDWVQAEVESAPDDKAARALAAVPAGASVTVYMGSWCGDSRRELARFWRALDDVGGEVPFAISYVGVDHAKKEPAALVQPVGLRYVPTFVVRRDGREVGRIVESAPHGIEQDLLALLTGTAHGLISERTDLAPGASPPPAPPGVPKPQR